MEACAPHILVARGLVLAAAVGLALACGQMDRLGSSADGTPSQDGSTTPTPIVGGTGNTGNAGGNETASSSLPSSLFSAHAQRDIDYISGWPRVPSCNGCSSWSVRDWKDSATRYHALLFNTAATGTYLPLSAWVGTSGAERIAMPSYVNRDLDTRAGGEALAVMGGLVGASAVGQDLRSAYGRDWLPAVQYYNYRPEQSRFVTNNVGGQTAGTAWYALFPAILEATLAYRYQDATYGLQPLLLETATTWASALNVLLDNWNHTGFDFRPSSRGVVDAGWIEPDMGIGIAYVAELAYQASGNVREDLNGAARAALYSMDARTTNPFYETLGFYGPLVAARRNALRQETHPVDQYVNWVFSASSSARNWGMVSQRWGNYDAYGLYGEIDNSSSQLGYAFAMNTFVAASALAPVVRYMPGYARAIGRYLLHVAVNGQLFFPDAMPQANQDAYAAYQALGAPISYEAVRAKPNQQPYATGDASSPVVNLNPYGAWAQGLMGALVAPTNVAEVLRIDLLATDPWHPPAHPSYLYYNPTNAAQRVQVDLGSNGAVDVVDVVSGTTLATNVTGSFPVTLAADRAVVLVLPPTGQAYAVTDGITTVGGVAIDWGL